MGGLFEGVWGERMRIAAFVIAIFLGLFLLFQAIASAMQLRYIGAGVMPANTITVSGYGESFNVPDIATFTFSVVSEKSTVAAAQDEATKKVNEITKYLKDSGVEEKDIKTSNYSVYPQYDYQNQVCPAPREGVVFPCQPGRQILRGYEVRQSTTVKVRDTAKAGDLLTGVGGKGATEVSGLNFTFDDPEKGQTEARDMAIANAKEKAEVLARSLGVSLVRVVSFNESGYPGPIPYYAKDTALQMGMGGAANERAVAPTISTGENQVTSNVSVTYEIR
ncbi:MAG TPA: SIMPL domain-containing protein [Candidatus Paceibacterota bacterium]|nr:SIMPL domain-containing protein [Candidatus Paceibacterota bacterium]